MDLKQKLPKENAKVFSFSFKDDFMSLTKEQTASGTGKVKNGVETGTLEGRQPPMFQHTHTRTRTHTFLSELFNTY